MLRLLKHGKADGVIIHKIDRSARNLKDWADLGELIDQGVEVHFANESLDLHSRGRRLSADIQAVVAADYIRNLREEIKKGFYGRIKQGLYPLPAPVGYLDMGKGKPKEMDPNKAPLVRKAFELYATGKHSLETLIGEIYRLGLRNRKGGKVTRTGLSTLLNNPFYIGLIRIRRTRETFPGNHEPLISKSLFDRVHRVLTGKTNVRSLKHELLFRRLLKCKNCGLTLIGEVQKGHTYYRCHTASCPTRCIREEEIQGKTLGMLLPLQLNADEMTYLQSKISQLKENWDKQKEDLVKSTSFRLGQLQDRLGRLTDAFIDGAVEREIFEERKTAFLSERKDLEEKLAGLRNGSQSVPDELAQFLELLKSAYLQYEMGLPDEKRDLLKILTSNRLVDGKNVEFELALPFNEVANRFEDSNTPPYRDTPRTLDRLFLKLVKVFKHKLAAVENEDRVGK